nr:hypothetical protein [Tanacetum cinerariifolium]
MVSHLNSSEDIGNSLRTIFQLLSWSSSLQSAFISNRQILDGLFTLNEHLSWCKYKKLKAMVFKVDFEKTFDSIRWDYLDDVLKSFGFGDKWRGWIRVMNAWLFTGIPLDNYLTISHLFYADDAIFVGKWDSPNLKIILKVLKCFHMASRLKININKSKLMGYGVHSDEVETAARYIGCATFVALFSHLGVKEGLGGGGFVVLRGKSLRESKNACEEEGGVEKMSSMVSKFMVRGEECLEGCVCAGGGEVKRSGDDFEVSKSLLGEIAEVAIRESGAGSEIRPPMLNKENYVPWSSRLLRYAKSRPNGKLIQNLSSMVHMSDE